MERTKDISSNQRSDASFDVIRGFHRMLGAILSVGDELKSMRSHLNSRIINLFKHHQ